MIYKASRHLGFTFIELIFSIAIIGVLASISLQSYQDYAIKFKIREAFTHLTTMKLKLERDWEGNYTFVKSCKPGTASALPTNLQYFTISCPKTKDGEIVRDDNNFLIVAEGLGFKYTLDQDDNRRTLAVPSGWTLPNPDSSCWVVDRSGKCA